MAYDTNLDTWVSSHAIHDLHCINFCIISHLSNLILKQNMNALGYGSVPGDSWEKRNWMISHRSCVARHSGLQNPHIYAVQSQLRVASVTVEGTDCVNTLSGPFPYISAAMTKKHSDQKQWKGSKVLCSYNSRLYSLLIQRSQSKNSNSVSASHTESRAERNECTHRYSPPAYFICSTAQGPA